MNTQSSKFCDHCLIYQQESDQHCSDCNVCIQGYDHHCIFFGKCIGRGNLLTFNLTISTAVINTLFLMAAFGYELLQTK